MKTIFNEPVYRIIELFYNNKNQTFYLREISRKLNLNESSISRHLNKLLKENILTAKMEGNLKKFSVNTKKISELFPNYDYEKFEELPVLRRNAIKNYVEKLDKKPLFLLVFGSTAKGTYRKDSDLDILQVSDFKIDNKKAIEYAGAQTGVEIKLLQLTKKQFLKELVEKKDNVVQSALNTGFPVFNEKYFYEVVYNE